MALRRVGAVVVLLSDSSGRGREDCCSCACEGSDGEVRGGREGGERREV